MYLWDARVDECNETALSMTDCKCSGDIQLFRIWILLSNNIRFSFFHSQFFLDLVSSFSNTDPSGYWNCSSRNIIVIACISYEIITMIHCRFCLLIRIGNAFDDVDWSHWLLTTNVCLTSFQSCQIISIKAFSEAFPVRVSSCTSKPIRESYCRRRDETRLRINSTKIHQRLRSSQRKNRPPLNVHSENSELTCLCTM